MAHSTLLKQLTLREAITDAIYRATHAFDTNDKDLFQSAWVKNGPIFVRNRAQVFEGLEAVMENIFDPVAKLETQHSVSNIRIELDNDAKAAHMVANMIAQHHRSGEAMDPTKKGLIGGAMNEVDLVLDDESGLWRMTKWVMNITWIDGDISIVSLPGY
jgi:hypothetical protein